MPSGVHSDPCEVARTIGVESWMSQSSCDRVELIPQSNVYCAKTSDLHGAISGLGPNFIREPPAVRLCVTFPDTCTCHLADTAFRY